LQRVAVYCSVRPNIFMWLRIEGPDAAPAEVMKTPPAQWELCGPPSRSKWTMLKHQKENLLYHLLLKI